MDDETTSAVWTDIGLAREKETNGTPLVTIFGAGVSGLSAAHELIERGFAVQVVEAREDPDEEYTCQVGGLAASQVAHIPADVRRLHPYLYNEDPDAEDSYTTDASDLPVSTSIHRGVQIWVVDNTPREQFYVRIDDKSVGPIDTESNFGIPKGTDVIAEEIRAAIVDELPDVSAVVVPGAAYDTVHVRSNSSREAPRVSIVLDLVTGQASQLIGYEQVRTLGKLRATPMQEAARRFPIVERIQFERNYIGSYAILKDAHGISNDDKLDAVWEKLKQAFSYYEPRRKYEIKETLSPEEQKLALSLRSLERELLFVEIRGHTDADGEPAANRDDALKWGLWVRAELIKRNATDGTPISYLAERLVVVPVGELEPLGNPRRASGRRRSNRVELRVVENPVPGEHGYRFFPRFYKHLFDTMKRTPILDAAGLETGETAFDRLEATEIIDLGFVREEPATPPPPGPATPHPRDDELHDPEPIPIRAPRSIEDLRRLIRIHLADERVNVTERDLVRFQFKLLKFLTASSERRKREWEKITWWTFLGADKPGYYSDEMLKVLQDTPQALAAMNAQETDARTMGTVYCQLLLDSLGDATDSNHTLDGPTSAAWFDQWKRYLKRQGVRFFCGELSQLVWVGEELLPLVKVKEGAGASVDVAVLVADDRRYALNVYGVRVEFDANGATDRAAIAAGLARAITAEPELPASAAPARAGSAMVRVWPEIDSPQLRRPEPFRLGELLLTVERPITRIPLEVNGIEIDLNDPTHVDQLRQGISIDQPWPNSARFAAKPDETLVSVVSHGPGEFGVSINGYAISIRISPAEWAEDIRDQLRDRIVKLRDAPHAPPQLERVAVGGFGRTGLRFSGATVDVGSWPGTMSLGPALAWDPSLPIRVVLGGSLSVASDDPGLGVIGAQAESAGQEFVMAPLDPGPTSGSGPDFYLLAVDYREASRLVWQAWKDPANELPSVGPDKHYKDLDGVFEQLRRFDQNTHYRDAQGELIPLERDGGGRPVPPHYPLRDLSGIQYFFEAMVRVGLGHAYFMHSPWGLSSISQLAYWRRRMSQKSAFLGQLSVDIGNFYRASEHEKLPDGRPGPQVRPSAWRSTKRQIAEETWRQTKAGLAPLYEQKIVDPRYFHLDRALLFERQAEREFGVPVVLSASSSGAGDFEIEIAGIKLVVAASSTSVAADLEDEIENQTDHLAFAFQPTQVIVAPVAANATELRLVVLEAKVGVEYRVAVNLSDTKRTATYQAQMVGGVADDIEAVRSGLIDAIHAELPGVIAVKDPKREHEAQARGIRLRAAQPIRVSALAWDTSRSLLAMNPTGSVRVKPLRKRFEIRFPKVGAVIENLTPYMINGSDWKKGDELKHVWRARPGIYDPRFEPAGNPPSPHVSLRSGAVDIFYIPTSKRWLMAGNQMATTTRVSSMESANESARHAVFSILHQLMSEPTGGNPPIYNGQGRLLGDLPDIWDPEERELPDTAAFKRLDERLVTHEDSFGTPSPLPHFLDILRIDRWVENLPELEQVVLDDEELGKLLKFARHQLRTDWNVTQLDEMESAARQLLRTLTRS